MPTTTIIVIPFRRYGVFDAFQTNGRWLCRSHAPLCAAARVLLIRGADPKSTIEMRHASNPDTVAMTAPIGIAAKYTVMAERFVRRPKVPAGPIPAALANYSASPASSPTPAPETRVLAGTAP